MRINRLAFISIVAGAAIFATASAFSGVTPKCGWRKALIVTQVDLKTVARVKGFGYDGMEIRLGPGMDVESAAAARRLAEREGVAIHSAMADGWYSFEVPEKFAAEVEKAKREIALAAAFGADTRQGYRNQAFRRL